MDKLYKILWTLSLFISLMFMLAPNETEYTQLYIIKGIGWLAFIILGRYLFKRGKE